MFGVTVLQEVMGLCGCRCTAGGEASGGRVVLVGEPLLRGALVRRWWHVRGGNGRGLSTGGGPARLPTCRYFER